MILSPKCRQAVAKNVVFSIVFAAFYISNTILSAEPASVLVSPGATGIDIQNALDSLPESGGAVILPAGNFEIHQPIVLRRDHQALRGAGAETILHLADGANCPVVILGVPVNSPKQIVVDARVGDLFIDGNRSKQQRELWRLRGEGSEIRNNGIQVQGVSNSIVENITCAHCRSGGLVTTRGVRRLTVRNFSSFDNQFDGLACYQTEDCLFEELNLHDNPGAGISLDLAFNHNVISNAVLAANDLGIFMRASSDNQFENISIRNSRHFGVFMAENIGQTRAGRSRSDCTNNSFNKFIADQCGGIAFRVNDVTCTNNFVSEAKFSGDIHAQLSMALPGLLMVK
ncbi:MAG TPA: right-handed parallel beta-helix repeat-containing protein [Methylomirabilota bacterium]|nr:right-handed parallel beta-helix repeat-containing protein [Methylomirabilota bacterium]